MSESSVFGRDRDFSQNWCQRGESWSEAVVRADSELWGRIETEFGGAGQTEKRAAYCAYVFTGLAPTYEDRQEKGAKGRSGAVDIALRDSNGKVLEIMEVTSSLDPKFESAARAISTLETEANKDYDGQIAWGLDLRRGWEGWRLKGVASELASSLSSLSPDSGRGPYRVHEVVDAWHTQLPGEPGINVFSSNAGSNDRARPYLDELSEYLHENETIRRKVAKLKIERGKQEASRTHLYIMMTALGRWGSLLPVSPSYFTWGEFSAPVGIDELWLDGGTGCIFRWTSSQGWAYHEVL
jgi:hypothetical protein